MQQLRCYGDDRNNGFCVHCGGPSETIDHVPSKVLLDEPYPENLMAAPACRECNNGLSLDEEYLACLLECVIAGDIAPEKLHRAKIGRILRANSSLLTRLQRARTDGAEGPVWAAENDRVSRVILKLARCHAAFELNEPQLHEPSRLGFKPLSLMTEKERTAFESDDDAFDVWPEVGSRAMQRLLVAGTDTFTEGWLAVQEGNYRFHTSQANGLTVKIVLREYLGCEVVWD
ncbi:hypothetical protein TX452_06445 [Pseudomonas aeruginosa]|jgi:hypothetical protein|uniref:hypothetical protein n=1 Tax=Pseudomonadota TaxID=1224 RepID=UPI00042DF9A6|nr:MULTISPECIES: hypothetical protein [Pseudomonadota]MBH1719617.1 hypothetical protein [Stenotrophomonas maltophilia]MCF6754052.1 hypothetical protein [Stutzerimonas stutzeri]EKY4184617.1 hypothetical protein [Pseudomonas aeruginosa]ELH7235980.1 hypothetical protein [Pseudomonas aeruginosa]ELT0909210.1 hypothetical protein [Pseudomonas aeruginosa]